MIFSNITVEVVLEKKSNWLINLHSVQVNKHITSNQ